MNAHSLRSLEQLPQVIPAETLLARPGLVDLWYFPYQETESQDPIFWDSHSTLLHKEEWTRHDRFVFPRDRLLFMATRILVRSVLSKYAPISPQEWQFSTETYGKPFLSGPPLPNVSALHFNLSNAHEMVICAVSTIHSQLGADVERMDRVEQPMDIAEHYFSAVEIAALRQLPVEQQHERFFAYWTLKESYIKARGLGLNLPLKDFSILLREEGEPPKEPQIVFAPELDDVSTNWRLALLRGSARHLVAVAVETGGAPLELRGQRFP